MKWFIIAGLIFAGYAWYKNSDVLNQAVSNPIVAYNPATGQTFQPNTPSGTQSSFSSWFNNFKPT